MGGDSFLKRGRWNCCFL